MKEQHEEELKMVKQELKPPYLKKGLNIAKFKCQK